MEVTENKDFLIISLNFSDIIVLYLFEKGNEKQWINR